MRQLGGGTSTAVRPESMCTTLSCERSLTCVFPWRTNWRAVGLGVVAGAAEFAAGEALLGATSVPVFNANSRLVEDAECWSLAPFIGVGVAVEIVFSAGTVAVDDGMVGGAAAVAGVGLRFSVARAGADRRAWDFGELTGVERAVCSEGAGGFGGVFSRAATWSGTGR